MLLSELRMLGGATLLGTDCRASAVARGREGRFDPAALRAVPPPLARRYFTTDKSFVRVSDELRHAVHWRTGDATRQAEPGAWDLILCRNVSMYLRCESAARLREVCESSLRAGGILVLGKAERPHGSTRLSQVGPCVYRKE
jgi:chemotaxis protein methyltransferase CheR